MVNLRRYLIVVLTWLMASLANPAWSQPENLGGWRYNGYKDFETTQPGTGVLYRYQLDGIRGDIFYYSAKHEWQDGLADPVFDPMMMQTLREMKAVEAAGVYRNLQFVNITEVQIAGQPFKRVHMTFVQHNLPSHSLLYLSALRGQLLKFRVTSPQDSSVQLMSDAERLIQAALDSQVATELPWNRR